MIRRSLLAIAASVLLDVVRPRPGRRTSSSSCPTTWGSPTSAATAARSRTPNLDALAAGGLRFTQFYNTARCCPTRASLLTGLYPHQAGHRPHDGGHGGIPGYRGDLNRHCRTIAEVLRPAGYRTYMVGKWHVTRHIAAGRPEAQLAAPAAGSTASTARSRRRQLLRPVHRSSATTP